MEAGAKVADGHEAGAVQSEGKKVGKVVGEHGDGDAGGVHDELEVLHALKLACAADAVQLLLRQRIVEDVILDHLLLTVPRGPHGEGRSLDHLIRGLLRRRALHSLRLLGSSYLFRHDGRT